MSDLRRHDPSKGGSAELMAQAEHDFIALALVVSTLSEMKRVIAAEDGRQLAAMPEPNQSTARAAMRQSFSVLCETVDVCIATSDVIAPEHLKIHARDAMAVAMRCGNYTRVFVGEGAAEVIGDHGAVLNHTLPTCETGRQWYTGGLSIAQPIRNERNGKKGTDHVQHQIHRPHGGPLRPQRRTCLRRGLPPHLRQRADYSSGSLVSATAIQVLKEATGQHPI